MAELIIDMKSSKQNSRYPAHGWAKNSQDVKLLWFPIRRLIAEAKEIRQDKSSVPMTVKDVFINPLNNNIRLLSTVLRELSILIREVSEAEHGKSEHEKMTAMANLQEMGHVYLDIAIIYLRRLADRLVYYSRPLLFDNFKIVPEDFRGLKKMLLNNLEGRYLPISDIKQVKHAFIKHSVWFDILTSNGHKGRRDALEHIRNLDIQFQYTIENGNHLVPQAYMTTVGSKTSFREGDLIKEMKFILKDMCDFCTDLSLAINGVKNGYWQGNSLFVLGKDDDATFFWPEI